jgi:hypothetical protein
MDLQQTQARKALNDEVKQTLASTLELGGDEVAAAYVRLSSQYETLILQANRLSGAEKQDAVEVANRFLSSNQKAISLNELLRDTERQYASVGAAINLVNAGIDARKTTGALGEIGGLIAQGKANAEAMQSMTAIRDRVIAAADAFDALNNKPAALAERLKASGIEAEMVKLAASVDLVGNQINKTFRDSTVTALDAVTDRTKTVSEAFRSMVADIAKNISHLINNEIAQMLWGGAGGKATTGFVSGILGSMFGGGSSVPNWGMDWAGAFATGTNFVPKTGLALVHKGEKITPVGQNGKGGDTFNIYAPGADAGGLARLESFIKSVNGSIEHRAVAAVADARLRGGTFTGIFRG